MSRRNVFYSLLLSSLFIYELQGARAEQKTKQEPAPVICGDSPRPMRISLRHIEGHGVGYDRGYSTVDGFFAPTSSLNSSWIPFLDLRGHVFNTGKFAANAGIGLRYLTSRVWGINAYYDYRNTNHQHYNQVSLGLESLGRVWDFRINGYLPVGKTESRFFGTKFSKFEGNQMILSRKREFAMKGGNAEVGAHITHMKYAALYAAAGPYYFENKGKHAFGGEARLALDISDYVRLEGNTSYDKVFRWIGQGQVSLIIPFGGKKKITQRNKGYTCSQELCVRKRALQRVDRNEIIVVDKKHQKSVAINPLTGLPYVFWFVDNTSHSAGTFESPFNTLLAAQNASSPNDVIYVFPGDGTTTGMDAGILLQNNQKFFGAGINQNLATTVGAIKIPAMASGNPSVININSVVIKCANNNEISGFNIIANGIGVQGIQAMNSINLSVHDNVISMLNRTGGAITNGIGLTSCLGQISINNNFFNYQDLTVVLGIELISTSGQESYFISNNRFIGQIGSPATGIELGTGMVQLGSFNSIIVINNQFTGLGTTGNAGGKPIGGAGFGGTTAEIIINGNTFSRDFFSGVDPALVLLRNRANLKAIITNNVWENSQDPTQHSLKIQNLSTTSSVCATVQNNISDSTGSAYLFDNSAGGSAPFIVNIANNIGTVQELGIVTPGTCP